jgi:hypothetical protein
MEGKTHIFGPHVATRDPTYPRHVINPREASPNESERAKWWSQRSKGPLGVKPTQNTTHTKNVPKGPHTNHYAKDGGEPAHKGFGRTDLVSVHPGLPHGAR